MRQANAAGPAEPPLATMLRTTRPAGLHSHTIGKDGVQQRRGFSRRAHLNNEREAAEQSEDPPV